MEELVQFKVYAVWEENSKYEVRRFGIEKSVVTSYHYLNAKLQDIYPGLRGKVYNISWRDDEGDEIVISSDEELMTALTALSASQLIKLYVTCKSDTPKVPVCDVFITADIPAPDTGATASTGQDGTVHFGVKCNVCNMTVVGCRYKCAVCEDYDLCARCEAAGNHREHFVVRLPSANLSRHLMKTALKRSRHLFKTMAVNVEECPYKRHRRERSQREGKDERPQGAGHHRRHTTWLDIFANYMNEFTNLAGDIDVNTERPKAPEANTTQEPNTPQEPAKEQPKTATANTQSAPQQAHSSAPNNAAKDFPLNPLYTPVNLESIRKTLDSCLARSPGLNAFVQENLPIAAQRVAAKVAAAAAFSQANVATASTSTQSTSTQSNEDVEMANSKKTSESGGVANSETSYTSANSDRDTSPDKAEGWTVINKEKDYVDELMDASAPAQPPIGFNLNKEFQEHVRINERGLYPPLNTATAVLNPQEVVLAPSAPVAEPSKPAQPKAAQAQAQPKLVQTPPQPTQRHPKAHIDAAIQQMLSMGFTNDGGWLTQLLESKDGNIAAVLDLLTPVTPKK